MTLICKSFISDKCNHQHSSVLDVCFKITCCLFSVAYHALKSLSLHYEFVLSISGGNYYIVYVPMYGWLTHISLEPFGRVCLNTVSCCFTGKMSPVQRCELATLLICKRGPAYRYFIIFKAFMLVYCSEDGYIWNNALQYHLSSLLHSCALYVYSHKAILCALPSPLNWIIKSIIIIFGVSICLSLTMLITLQISIAFIFGVCVQSHLGTTKLCVVGFTGNMCFLAWPHNLRNFTIIVFL